jgi:hypothetical protein
MGNKLSENAFHSLVNSYKRHEKKVFVVFVILIISSFALDPIAIMVEKTPNTIILNSDDHSPDILIENDLLITLGDSEWTIRSFKANKTLKQLNGNYSYARYEISPGEDSILFHAFKNGTNIEDHWLYNIEKQSLVNIGSYRFISEYTFFSETGKYFSVRNSTSGITSIYETETQNKVFETSYRLTAPYSFSMEDKWVIFWNEESIFIYATNTWQMLKERQLDSLNITFPSIQWSSNNAYLIVSGYAVSYSQGDIRWVALNTSDWETVYSFPPGNQNFEISPTGSHIIFTNTLLSSVDPLGLRKTCACGYRIYNTQNWTLIEEDNSVYTISSDFSDDGSIFVMYNHKRDQYLNSGAREIVLFNTETEELIKRDPFDGFEKEYKNVDSLTEGSVALSFEGKFLAYSIEIKEVEDYSYNFGGGTMTLTRIKELFKIIKLDDYSTIYYSKNLMDINFHENEKYAILKEIYSNLYFTFRLSDGKVTHEYNLEDRCCSEVLHFSPDLFIASKRVNDQYIIYSWENITEISIIKQISLFLGFEGKIGILVSFVIIVVAGNFFYQYREALKVKREIMK